MLTLIYNSKPKDETDSGFTLLEVLISMAILVFISFSIYQATVETYRLRDTLSSDGDFYNGIRLSMGILQSDIATIYSPIIGLASPLSINTPVDQQKAAALQVDNLGRSMTFWSPAVEETGLRPSHFIGSEDKMSFVTVSHVRIYKDSPESDLAKVTYELKKDEDDSSLSILVKTESPNVFAADEIKDTFSHSYELLRGIKKLSYTYYQKDGNTWKNFRTWDTEHEETKNIFPSIIELKMEVISRKKQSFTGKFKFRPEIPINGLNPSF